jgi:hypothetical protein
MNRNEGSMIGRFVVGLCLCVGWAALGAPGGRRAHAQDVPGIEICTVEKTMERRTSCLQSNVEFIQKTIARLTLDHQQKLDAANRQIEALKANVITLQKIVDDLKTAQGKPPDNAKKPEASLPKDAAARDAASKDAPKSGTAKDSTNESGK